MFLFIILVVLLICTCNSYNLGVVVIVGTSVARDTYKELLAIFANSIQILDRITKI